MRQIFLHAGQTKTGTTAVQGFLNEHREALLRVGYLYPKAGASHIGNHAPLISDILGEMTSVKNRDSAKALADEISVNPTASVIISAERVSRYLHICKMQNIDKPRLITFLLSFGLPLTIVLYVRSRTEWINSKYVQGVKSFLTCDPFDDFLAREVKKRNTAFSELPHLSLPAGANITFRPFNDEVRRRGVTRDFLAFVGLSEGEIDALGEESRANESIGPIALAAARETLRRIRGEGNELTRRQCTRMRSRLLELIEAEEPEPSFFGVTCSQADLIDSTFSEDTRKFADAAWGKEWGEVFPPPRATRQSNVFDIDTASEQDLGRYRRLLDGLWSTAREVVADSSLAEARPWERPRGRAVRNQPGRVGVTKMIKNLEASHARNGGLPPARKAATPDC